MKVLYLGHGLPETTSRHRADALGRLGHEVALADPYEAFRSDLSHPLWGRLHFRSGYRALQKRVRRWLVGASEACSNPDLIWVDGGELFGPDCFSSLGKSKAPIVFFNVDDPTGPRDGRRFDLARAALPLYNLCVTVRRETEAEMRTLGATNVLRVWRAYDEVAHAPFKHREEIAAEWHSEVAFIGTWMRNEGRDVFLTALLDAGVPISIWGDRWDKAPLWPRLKTVWRGAALGGREYVAAVQGAKLCLGMLSKGNRDLHTTRSAEIPYSGGLFCAQRTNEHLEMYRENQEAVFWDDSQECAQVCGRLLSDDSERESIRANGMRRVRELQIGNEDIARQVLAKIGLG